MDDTPELTPLEFAEVCDINVLGGAVPMEGMPVPHVFLALSILGKEDNPLTINYGMSPWEAIRLGVALGEVGIQMTQAAIGAAAALREMTAVPAPHNEPGFL